MSSIYLMYGMMFMSVLLNNNYLLMCLMSLEGLMLSVLFLLVFKVILGLMSYCEVMVFMYVVVSEGVMGLSLLVFLVRGVGNDMFFYHDFI